MKYTKYFIQFILVLFCFVIFKIIGPKISSNLSGKLFEKIGPSFRPKKIIHSNLKKAFPSITEDKLGSAMNLMWNNYGRTFAEYIFMKDFRFGRLKNNIEIEGQEIIDDIKNSNKQVVFISGHLANFELMAMHLEKSGLKLSAIYRPLNNIFLNLIMEKIRNKYICRIQIKKGLGGLKKLINFKNKNYSTALMIDQRVSEGIKCKFFGQEALTTTIPAQFVKKFNCKIVPIHIKRNKDNNFKLKILKPLSFYNDDSIETITLALNSILEKMIIENPGQWIWTHNRWK